VFSRNRGGAYVRSKVSPVQPQSEWSSRARCIFKAVAQRWSAVLTDIQRVAWEAFAAVHPFVNVFGDSITLSGVAFFEAVNVRIRQCGDDWVDDPPSSFVVEDLGDVVVEAIDTAGTLAVTVTAGRSLGCDEGLYVFSTPPILTARVPQRTDFRLVNTPATGLFASASDIVAPLTARFPDAAWPVGTAFSVLVACLNKSTGAISAAVKVDVVVTAAP
jgi:hypothetical protein